MTMKKAGKKLYGATLTASEKKAMKMEIQRQLADYDVKHADELDALVLWVLHSCFGFGTKRLRRFYDNFMPELEALLNRYELDDSDQVWLCTLKLKERGIDITKWRK